MSMPSCGISFKDSSCGGLCPVWLPLHRGRAEILMSITGNQFPDPYFPVILILYVVTSEVERY